MRQIALFIYSLAMLLSTVNAAEIDSFTIRYHESKNSMAEINELLGSRITAGMEIANHKSSSCDPDTFYESIKDAIISPFIGHFLVLDMQEKANFDFLYTAFEDSIFQDFRFYEAPSVHAKGLSPLLNLDGHIVGLDKFGHFFVEGWGFFKRAYLNEEININRAITWGAFTERSYFGFMTTSIFSNADLIANFNGMRFWLRLLGQKIDPINSSVEFNRPYFRCNEGQWVQQRDFDFAEYLDGTWDEGNNCNYYRTKGIRNRIADRIQELEDSTGLPFTCPIKKNECREGMKKYKNFSKFLLHPKCKLPTLKEDRDHIIML